MFVPSTEIYEPRHEKRYLRAPAVSYTWAYAQYDQGICRPSEAFLNVT